MSRMLLCLFLLLSAACSKGSGSSASGGSGSATASAGGADPTASAAAEPAATPAAAAGGAASGEDPNRDLFEKYGACEVTFEGDLQKTYRSPGGASALGSDYFMNDAELRQALKMLAGPAKVEEAMKKDPRLYVLIVSCSIDDLNLSFGAGANSTYADVPFGPKKYEIGNGKGQIAMLASVEGYKKLLRAAPGGTFEITRFDGAGLAATFELNIEGDLKGKLRGKIDYRCAHDTSVCVAARAK